MKLTEAICAAVEDNATDTKQVIKLLQQCLLVLTAVERLSMNKYPEHVHKAFNKARYTSPSPAKDHKKNDRELPADRPASLEDDMHGM